MKVLFLDIDGTITNEKGEIAIASIKAIKRLRNNDFLVIASSSNSYYVVKTLNHYFNLFDYIIAESGGVLDLKEELKVLADIRVAKNAASMIKAQIPNLKEHWSNPIRLSDQAFLRPRDEGLILNVKKLVEQNRELKVKIIDTNFSLLVVQEGISKAKTAKLLLEKLDLREAETYAIGDSEADLEIFEFVEHPWALANSDSRLKRIAELESRRGFSEGFVELAELLLKK